MYLPPLACLHATACSPEAVKKLAKKQGLPNMYLSLLYQLQSQAKARDKAVATERLKPALHAVALYMLKDSNPGRALGWESSMIHSEVSPPGGRYA